MSYAPDPDSIYAPEIVAALDERLERFARTRDPRDLWPGLNEAARIAGARELERVTRLVLAGHTGVRLDPQDVLDPYALAVAGHTTGMGPLVGRWLSEGHVTTSAPYAEGFTRHLVHARRRADRIEREVLPAIDALLAGGIVPVVLKGFHTARAYFEEPSVRRMSDVDLLVEPQQVRNAEIILGRAGFRPNGDALRPYKRDWLWSDVDDRIYSVELSDERSRWALEMHASLDRSFHPGAVARLDAERARTRQFAIAGRTVAVLEPAVLLLSLTCHASQELDNSRLLRLVEIVRVIRAERSAGQFWNEVIAMMRRTATARYTYPAFALAEELAPGTVDERALALARRASTWAARDTVRRLIPAGGSLDNRGVLRQVMWTSGPVALVQRVLRNLWPASFVRPGDVVPGWRVRLRRMRSGALSLRAPDERSP